MRRKSLIVAALLCGCLCLGAQNNQNNKKSDKFDLGQWIEIQNAILRSVYNEYVDSLDIATYFRTGIDASLAGLDPYTVFVPESENENFELLINKSYGGIGAIIRKEKDGYVVISEPYEGSPAVESGLRCGDAIMEVDGVDVRPLASDEATALMKGKPDTKVKFKVQRGLSGKIEEVVVTRKKIHIPDIAAVTMLDSSTGYIQQTGFTSGVAEEIRKAVVSLKLQGMKRLVLDLRGNGGGLMQEAINIVSIFVPKGSLVVTQKGRGEGTVSEYYTRRDPLDENLPLMILIDGSSASASEIVAGALQDLDRATVMGTKSYGKGLVQSVRQLPYNSQLKVTTAHYYTPSGRCVQKIDYSAGGKAVADSLRKEFKTAGGRVVKDAGGITPDIEIKTETYPRPLYAIVGYSSVLDEFAIDFCKKHASIAPAKDFHLSDQQWKDFVAFASEKEFDHRPESLATLDRLSKEIAEDGYASQTAAAIESLRATLDVSKTQCLESLREQLIPFIERDIIIRYYYQQAGALHMLPYDTQLQEAISTPWIF